MIINDVNDLILYLYDIDEYVNNILLYHKGYDLDLKEILMYLSSINEIIENLVEFINENYYR